MEVIKLTTKPITADTYLSEYFEQWVKTFKKPIISPVTYIKYQNTHRQIKEYFGETRLCDITRTSYQTVINDYAKVHSKRTTSCFHKQIRASILDAVDEQLINIDPTRKAVITGRLKKSTKSKYLHNKEWQLLIQNIDTYNHGITHNLIIYLAAVTGMRFAEILGLTWKDINFSKQQITINKTWDYKYHTGFIPTKNNSSVRIIDIDKQTIKVLQQHQETQKTWRLNNPHELVCMNIKGKLPVSATINRHLERLCEALKISIISFHGLRHTHASVLLFQGVNLMAVSKRLGHSNVTTTQNIYLHIIREMEDRETNLIIGILDKNFN